MRVLGIGTCRVAHPINVLNKAGDNRSTFFPHSFYNASQIIQALRTFDVQHNPYHCLISGEAISRALKQPHYHLRHWEIERAFVSPTKRFDGYIIEISALHECFIRTPSGRFDVDYVFPARRKSHRAVLDQLVASLGLPEIADEHLNRPRMPDMEASRSMQRIYRMVRGKPVLWVAGIDMRQDLSRELSDVLRQVATETDTQFFDPGEMIRSLGPEQILRVGSDTHFSDAGLAAQAAVFKAWMDGEPHPWIVGARQFFGQIEGEQTEVIETFEVVCDEDALQDYAAASLAS
jgi:hypothetical protein